MAWIEIGPFFDQAPDDVSRLFIPDIGELPEYPHNNQTMYRYELREVSGNGFARNLCLWMDLPIVIPLQYWSCVLFVECRSEWVCFQVASVVIDRRDQIYRYAYTGPYQVPEGILAYALRAYDIPWQFAAIPEMRRCHPDILEQMQV